MRATLLTQADCQFCDQAQEILRRLAPEYGLEVELVDLSTTKGQSLSERAGVLFPPGLLIDGEPFSYGRVSERRLRKELARRMERIR